MDWIEIIQWIILVWLILREYYDRKAIELLHKSTQRTVNKLYGMVKK